MSASPALALALGLALAACTPESVKTMDPLPIRLELLAEPSQLSMASRQDFKVGLAATNLGSATIDPQLHRVRLLVDDRESTAWSLAVGNGRREDKWYALPAGETVALSWTSLGESLFPAAGEYTLVLRLDAMESRPVRVRVAADG